MFKIDIILSFQKINNKNETFQRINNKNQTFQKINNKNEIL